MSTLLEPDGRGRVGLKKFIDAGAMYEVHKEPDGKIVLEPHVAIPKWKADVLHGIDQAKQDLAGPLPTNLQNDIEKMKKEILKDNGKNNSIHA